MSYSRWVDWIDEAEDDYGAAMDMMRLGRYSKACYLAQQAAEKALKALLIRATGRYAHTHSVVELLSQLRDVGISVGDELLRAGEDLDRHYVPSRYPNAWPAGAPHRHYKEEDARKALESARLVMEFVRRNIRGGQEE